MPSLPGFCGGTYVSESPNVDCEEAINVFCEHSGSAAAKVPIALFLAPGKRLFCELPEAGIFSEYTVNGRSFVAGSQLWELFADGSFANRGILGVSPTRPTQMISNQNQLGAINNGALFVLDLATNVLTAVDPMMFNGPISQIDFCDGFGLVTIQNSHTFQQSNLEDLTTWNGLNISTISYFPDNITSFKVDHREPWFYSGKKTIAYYNAGAGFPVFIPVPGGYMEFGAFEGATFCTNQADNTLVWIDQDDRGGLMARKAVGYGEQRISTHAVEHAWQQYDPSTLQNLISFVYQEDGHTFWEIKFPDISWAYDFASGFWAKRAHFNSDFGTFEANHAQCHTYNFGLHLVGDPTSGKIYKQSIEFLRDNGQPLKWLRRSPILAQDNQWITTDAIELDVEAGLTPEVPLVDGDGEPRPAQVMLRWSHNAGKIWSNEFTLSVGFPGQFDLRVRRAMCGRGRKTVFEWSGSDPISWRIADCLIDATPALK